jgi:ABC-type Fe3+ transport system permease subunit
MIESKPGVISESVWLLVNGALIAVILAIATGFLSRRSRKTFRKED